MRFTLALISAAVLANLANAAPAAISQSNMGIDATLFKAEQTASLQMNQAFDTFHWMNNAQDNTIMVDRTFSFELAEPAELQVTDFMMGGDVFEIIDNGMSLGMTSEVEAQAEGEPLYIDTPEAALDDQRFSKAAYSLEAGKHEITVKVVDTLSESGTGALRIVQKLQSLSKKKHKGENKDDDEDEDEDDEDDDEDDDDEDEKYDKEGGKGDWSGKKDDKGYSKEGDKSDWSGKKDDKGGQGDGWEKKKKEKLFINLTVEVPALSITTQTITTATDFVTVTVTSIIDVTDTVTSTRLLDLPFLTVA